MRILLQPSSGKVAMDHYDDTIANGVTVETLKEYLSTEELQRLIDLKQDKVKIWGIVPTLKNEPRSQWLNLNEDDVVLFYKNKSIYFFGKVLLKAHNKSLATQLWGNDNEGRTWEYIYFLKEGKQIQVPYKPELLGYKSNHAVMGAMLLNESQSLDLLKYLQENEGQLIDESLIKPNSAEESFFIKKIKLPKTPEEATQEINKISEGLKGKPVKEVIKTAKILSRNPLFARLVKEKAKYTCDICGEKPFIQKNGLPYAEAHHLLELSKTRIDNPNKMICVCPTCHRVIHFGNEESLEKRRKLKK